MRPALDPDPRAVAIALAVVLAAVCVFTLILLVMLRWATRRVDQLEQQAEQCEQGAGYWRARYYTAAADRDHLARRNSQLTSALRLTTDLAGELRRAEDDAVIEEYERDFRDHS